ncbi:family 78 glycoside hydrolase catalytic domain [Herbiconiux ginsengi]|uniref:alpha-L-rhamnosidase n=1 Tax=Herbiconiux ginsengi TaxID=381665 RepID=A0A1H3LLZ4_9MICO|nr:family 78 glycoside hydrolase catalytic domain [Herbiconiux ginsengi]SDY64875.1 alpha-L-rhamnosidase [Herbiconiux ginsengi]
MTDPFGGAHWISRPVPRSARIVRQITRTRTDWAEPGHTLAQSFHADGPVAAVNLTLVELQDIQNPYTTDVKFSIALETPAGDAIARRDFEGPQLVWDYFGPFLDVAPTAPSGDYLAVLRVERGTIGWATADMPDAPIDDGVSPVPLTGTAFADGQAVDGARMLGIDTIPAPNPVFRRSFRVDTAPASATLAAVVLGTGVVTINGHRVGDEALEPAVTDYDRTVLYRTWDVAHLLREGENEIVVEAGRERYAARGGDTWGWHLAPWHREPTALARLEIVGADGSSASIVTDDQWECAPGAVEAERLFRGEDWVVRSTEAEWTQVVVVTGPAGELRLNSAPPVKALAPRPAALVERLDPQRTVYDFGEVMVGRIRCRVSGAPGAVIQVRSGEQRTDDGAVICDNNLVAGEAQLDTLRLEKSVTDYLWEPQFGYRGFRWMQVEVSGDVTVEDVRAILLYADVERVGELRASEPVVEWIDTATARTFRNNLHGIPTDTPIYEKNGWTADAHLATEGLLHHFDLRDAFGKWMDDHTDAQSADGSMPQIIPTPGWGRASDPAWSASAVLIPWYLYREYGDRAILERSADTIRRYADQTIRALDGALWSGRTWGDWLSPGHTLGPEGMPSIGTIMAVTVLQYTASVMRELGDPASEHYDDAAAGAAANYHNAFFDLESGTYRVPGVGYRQALNILPLAFGIVPDRHVTSVRAGLIADIEERTDGHLDCGAVGVRHLLPVLSAAGRDDLALTILTRRTRPGWGAWFENGESTLLESWDPDARSRNHYFLGSVSAWIQQRVGGLRLTEPGWRRFEIAPVDDARVSRASIRHRTPLGEARAAWERGPGGWRFEVTVPAGASARIVVPGGERELSEGDHIVRISA